MSSTRLFILQTLAEHGPLHGHRVLRQAQEDRTDLWTDCRASGVYGGIKRLAREGLIAELYSEQDGSYPVRVVYGLTDAGREALSEVRDTTLRRITRLTDPFDLALAHCHHVDPATLEEIVTTRLRSLEAELDSLQSKRAEVDRWLTEAERLAFDHGILRCETEVSWHRTLLEKLPVILAEQASPHVTT